MTELALNPEQSEAVSVSIVVCTFNRAGLLKIALDSLERQEIDPCTFEVIVVNNNCSDGTAKVVQEFAGRNSNYRMVTEPNQGLSHARNKGYMEALGKYVAYIDDDAKAPSSWVGEILRFAERHPDIECFGGPYFEYSLERIPEWLPAGIRSHTLGDTEHVLAPGEWIHGCNMVFSRSILQKYGGFNPKFGMRGRTIGYGEETELLQRLSKDMVSVYYVPTLYVDHIIDKQKRSLMWHLRSYYADGKYSVALFDIRSSVSHSLFAILKALLNIPVLFFQEKGAPAKRRLFYALRPVFYAFGACSGMREKQR